MDDIDTRLVRCFATVFPEESPDALQLATMESIEAWDCIALSSSKVGRRFFLGLLKTVDHFLGHVILRLDLIEYAVLIFQVGLNFSRMLQNEGDSPVNFRERSNGRVCLEDRFRHCPRRKS
jgi:hypothetical protein